VYLTEVIFGSLSMNMAIYYYRNIWLPITFLVLPGGLIAFFCKKENIPGSIILGLGNTIQAVLGVFYLVTAMKNFPYHILTALFCFSSIFVMSFCIQKKKINRLIALLVPVFMTALILFGIRAMGRSLISVMRG